MAVKTYGTTVIPSDIVKVRAGSTVSISLGFNATLGLVGNMDVENGETTPGTIKHIEDTSDAVTYFGEGSELAEQVRLAFANDTPDIYAVGVSENSQTESVSSASTGTLGNFPIVDPNVASEHTITVTDTSSSDEMNVNVVYGSGSPDAPAEPETVAINGVTGEWTADAASSYDFTYETATFDQAIQDMAMKNIRYLGVCTENETVANTLISVLNDHAQDFDFMRGLVGGMPGTLPSDYTNALDEQRLCVVEPARAYLDVNEQNMVRTVGAVVGHLTSRPLGESATGSMHGALNGLVRLNQEFSVSECGAWIEKQVMPLRHSTNIHIVKDMTTSSVTKFERVYATEISDEVALLSHLVAEQFVGSLNFDDNRESLELSLEVPIDDMASDRPPLLTEYVVNVSEGESDFDVDVEIGIDVVGVMDQINVNISVGEVSSSFEGTE